MNKNSLKINMFLLKNYKNLLSLEDSSTDEFATSAAETVIHLFPTLPSFTHFQIPLTRLKAAFYEKLLFQAREAT